MKAEIIVGCIAFIIQAFMEYGGLRLSKNFAYINIFNVSSISPSHQIRT